jgi:Glycosyltransferase family 87
VRRLWPGLLCAAAAVYLLIRVQGFCSEALQLDLSAYVSAAEAVRFGLDPYRTHPDHRPAIWDGVSRYTHSRFLYPPLVADFFLPFTFVPYALAKWVFTAVSLGALLGSVLLAWRSPPASSPDPLGEHRPWLGLAFLLTAYPVLTLLERGQIDALTLLLVVAAWAPALRGSRPGLVSGLLLALATLLKLNAAYLVAFWALRRFWRGLAGFGLGAAALAIASAAIDGPAATRTYFTQELPRVARYGEEGSPAMRLPAETLAHLRGDAPEGSVWRDGRLYRIEGFGFAANASGARVLTRLLGAYRARSWYSLVSLLIASWAVGLLAWAGGRGSFKDPRAELAYLAAALAAVLLAGPLTWTMNVVWLAIAGVLLARAWPNASAQDTRALVALGLGLFLAWLPDQYALAVLFATSPSLGDYKYVAGELIVLVSLSFWIRGRRRES